MQSTTPHHAHLQAYEEQLLADIARLQDEGAALAQQRTSLAHHLGASDAALHAADQGVEAKQAQLREAEQRVRDLQKELEAEQQQRSSELQTNQVVRQKLGQVTADERAVTDHLEKKRGRCNLLSLLSPLPNKTQWNMYSGVARFRTHVSMYRIYVTHGICVYVSGVARAYIRYKPLQTLTVNTYNP